MAVNQGFRDDAETLLEHNGGLWLQHFKDSIQTVYKRENGDSDNKKVYDEVAPYFLYFELSLSPPSKDGGQFITDQLRYWSRSPPKKYIVAYLAWLSSEHADHFEAFFHKADCPLTPRQWEGPLPKLPTPEALSQEYRAFICFSGETGKAIATRIKEFFGALPYNVRVFLSSVDINPGSEWHEALTTGLKEANSGLFILTQEAIDSSYLLYEFGALSVKLKAPSVLLANASREMLPAPFKAVQSEALSKETLTNWIRGLLADLPINSAAADALWPTIGHIISEGRQTSVPADDRRWRDNVSRPLLINRQNDSPFDLEATIIRAQVSLSLVAQNHWYMTADYVDGAGRFWSLIYERLACGVNFDIACMHPETFPTARGKINVPSAVDLWSHYQTSTDFYWHLKRTWDVLSAWADLYEAKRKEPNPNGKKWGELRIVGAYFTPLTMTMVDPGEDEGFIVLSPRTENKESAGRPQFIVRRRFERQVFDYLKASVDIIFNNANSVGVQYLQPYELTGEYAIFDPERNRKPPKP